MQHEGLIHTLVKKSECATFVPGQVIVPIQEMGVDGWYGDLNVLNQGSCTMLVGAKDPLQRAMAALSSVHSQADNATGHSMVDNGASDDASSNRSVQVDNVLQCSVVPGEPLIAEALERWHWTDLSAAPSSATTSSIEEKLTGGDTTISGTLAANVIDLEVSEDISTEEKNNMTIVLRFNGSSGEDSTSESSTLSRSTLTLIPGHPQSMSIGNMHASADSSLEVAVYRETKRGVGSSTWGTTIVPFRELDCPPPDPSSQQHQDQPVVRIEADAHGTESEERAAFSKSQKPESSIDYPVSYNTPWREAKPKLVVPVTETTTYTTTMDNTIPEQKQKRNSILSYASSAARRRVSSMFTVVSPAALLGSVRGEVGINEGDMEDSEEDTSDSESEDEGSGNIVSDDSATIDTITSEDATLHDPATVSCTDETRMPRNFVLYGDTGAVVGRIKIELKYSPPALSRSSAGYVDGKTTSGNHLQALLDTKEKFSLSYAVVATSLCQVYQIPCPHILETLSFYRFAMRSPTTRLVNMASQSGKRRVSVMRVGPKEENGAVNCEKNDPSGGLTTSRRESQKRARKSTSRHSSALSTSLTRVSISDGLTYKGQNSLELMPSYAANSKEYGQSSIDAGSCELGTTARWDAMLKERY